MSPNSRRHVGEELRLLRSTSVISGAAVAAALAMSSFLHIAAWTRGGLAVTPLALVAVLLHFVTPAFLSTATTKWRSRSRGPLHRTLGTHSGLGNRSFGELVLNGRSWFADCAKPATSTLNAPDGVPGSPSAYVTI